MPQKCSICKHPQRDAIEQSIRNGDTFRHIAAQYDTNTGSLQRHKKHMVLEVAVAAPKEIQVRQSKAADLIDELVGLKNTLSDALQPAIESGNILAITALSRELRGVMDSLLKIAIAQKEIEAQKQAIISPELDALIQEIIA